MSFLKFLDLLSKAGYLLTVTGQLLRTIKVKFDSGRETMSQDSSIPNNGEEDEKPAEDQQHEFPFMRGQ